MDQAPLLGLIVQAAKTSGNRSAILTSGTRLDGRCVLRLAVGNERTTEETSDGPGRYCGASLSKGREPPIGGSRPSISVRASAT